MADLILRGPLCKDPKIDMGMGEYFLEQAHKFGDKIFQIDGDTGKKETYKDAKKRSIHVAIHLQKIGIKSKDIVLVCCRNNLDNIVPVLAAHYLGAYIASVDPIQAVADVEHALKLTEPRTIIVERDSIDLIERSLEDLDLNPHIIAIGDTSGKYPNLLDIEKNSEGENSFTPVKLKGSDIAVILFSSGTTSTPKGIYRTHGALLNVAATAVEHNFLKPGVILHISSMYWGSSWFLTAVCIVTGTTKVVAPVMTPEKFLEDVEKYKVTCLFCSNTFTYQLTSLDKSIVQKYDTSSLNSVMMGGSVADPEQTKRLKEYLPHTHVNLVYGSSEAAFIAGHDDNSPEVAKEKITSSGRLFPGNQMKFVDMDTGKLLGPNQKGEIRVKTEAGIAGYHNYSNPNAFDEDGFFKVGDIGYYDEDGYIYVKDRINEMFKYRNLQLSPAVLETVLLQHPSVAEAVVFGVPHVVDQHHPAACVVLKSGLKATPQELIDFFNGNVADYQRLRGGLMVLDSMPKTPTGKLQRKLVKENFINKKQEELNRLTGS